MSQDIYETHEGSAVWDKGQQKLLVSYELHTWGEAQPYGNTVAYEPMSECEPIEYQLNGEHVTYEELVERFGADLVENKINEAME